MQALEKCAREHSTEEGPPFLITENPPFALHRGQRIPTL